MPTATSESLPSLAEAPEASLRIAVAQGRTALVKMRFATKLDGTYCRPKTRVKSEGPRRAVVHARFDIEDKLWLHPCGERRSGQLDLIQSMSGGNLRGFLAELEKEPVKSWIDA